MYESYLVGESQLCCNHLYMHRYTNQLCLYSQHYLDKDCIYTRHRLYTFSYLKNLDQTTNVTRLRFDG